MRKVAVLVLLSLSSCLSLPTESAAPAKNGEKVTTSESSKPKEVTPLVPAHEEIPPPATKAQGINKTASENSTESTQNATQTEANNNTTKSMDNNNTTDKKEEKTVTENAIPAKTETKPNTPTETASKNETKPSEKPKNDVTTQKNEISSKSSPTTEEPKSDGKETPLQARGFDGPSFIGGIILTLGLLAIGFMGFKYYKNQTERNYHTL